MAPVTPQGRAIASEVMEPQPGSLSRQPTVEDGSPYIPPAVLAAAQRVEFGPPSQPDSQTLPYRNPKPRRQAPGRVYASVDDRVCNSPGPIEPAVPVRSTPSIHSSRASQSTVSSMPSPSVFSSGPSPSTPSSRPSPRVPISKQSTVELDRGEDTYYEDNDENMADEPLRSYGSSPASAAQPLQQQYQTPFPLPQHQKMQAHPMYGGYGNYQPVPHDPRFAPYPQQYANYGYGYPPPMQMQPRGHTFRKVVITGNARAIQGNVRDPGTDGSLLRDHDFGETIQDGGRLFQGDVTSEQMKDFWN